jgi:hypothetical protein
MKYPSDFPSESRARVEAEKILAGRDFNSAREHAQWSWDVEKLLRQYILRVFLVFANEARRLRLWALDKMDGECREFLRLLTIEAHYEKAYDRMGRRMLAMHEHGYIRPEVSREFQKTPEWKQYQDTLLEMVPLEPLPMTAEVNSRNRRRFVDPILVKKGWSDLDLAKHSDLDFHTVKEYLRGNTNPSRFTRKKLSNALNVEVEDLPS